MTEWLKRVTDTGNMIRFLLSFVLAFALWAWVTVERDPEQTYRAPDVPVVAQGLPGDLSLVDGLEPVEVTLYGPRSVIQTIDSASIRAYVDLSDIDEAGEYTREIEVDVPDGIRKVETNPESVTFEVDNVVSETFDLRLLSPEDLPRNLAVTDTAVSTEEVTVTGVAQNVERVAQVLLPVEIAGQTSGFTTEVEPEARDANNQRVTEVEVTPSRVTLTVDLEIRGKEVPVFVQCGSQAGCTAAEGFEVLGQPQASPSTVLVDGPQDQLAGIQFVYTVPVNTAELTETTVIPDVLIDTSTLGEEITVEPATVNVSVQVQQGVFQREFDGISVDILNARPNTRVSVSPPIVSLALEGPRDAIEMLQEDEISVVVDVSDLESGTHQLIPQVVLPPRVRYSDPPSEVTVTIVETAPPTTPEPEPTPSATGTFQLTPTATP
ncbi:MAG: CdaR family protein [Chloroflexota bacterium]|nr:CdaR family protein [Chloroflexota bacterium]